MMKGFTVFWLQRYKHDRQTNEGMHKLKKITDLASRHDAVEKRAKENPCNSMCHKGLARLSRNIGNQRAKQKPPPLSSIILP